MTKTVAPEHMKGLTRLCRILRAFPVREMNLRYDDEAAVLYIKFTNTNAIRDSELTDSGYLIEYDAKGKIVGLKILDASRR